MAYPKQLITTLCEQLTENLAGFYAVALYKPITSERMAIGDVIGKYHYPVL